MSGKPIHVLLVEDNPGDARLVCEMLDGDSPEPGALLSESGEVEFELECVTRLSDGLQRLSAGGIDVVLLDLSLPDSMGLDTFARAQAHVPQVPIVVLTARGNEALAGTAVRAGAQDFLSKGQIDENLLVRTICHAIERKQAEMALRRYAERLKILHEIDRAILSVQSPAAIAQVALHHVQQLVPCQRATVVAFDFEAGEAIIIADSVDGEHRQGDNVRFSLARYEIAQEFRQGQMRLIEDMLSFSRSSPADQILSGNEICSYVNVPLMAQGELIGSLNLGARELAAFDPEHLDIAREVADLLAITIQQARLHEQVQRYAAELEQRVVARTAELRASFVKLQRIMEETVNALVSATEKRDPYTAGHQQRVAHLAGAIAREMGLSEEQIEGIRVAGALHDIGKIYVPAEILNKPGRLAEIEFTIIKTHPQVSYDIIKEIEFPWPVAQTVLQHHERMNGSGYPQGLTGEDIALEARILAVADVVEAMASHRPYRPILGLDEALDEISQNKDSFYDPQVVDACLALFAGGFRLE